MNAKKGLRLFIVLVWHFQGEVITSLESMGFRVGESLMERVSKDVPRFRTELDAMIFMCKQFWTHLFNKQIDNLKTNNQVTPK